MITLLVHASLMLLIAIQVSATSIQEGSWSNAAQFSADTHLAITCSTTNQLEFVASAQQPNKFVRTRILSKRLKSNKRATKSYLQRWEAISDAGDTDQFRMVCRHQHISSKNCSLLLALYGVFQI
ncbi:hypothetical protein [Tunicatimonas pelagia]|uniref:hypothetical protein n=1 Tax=Tunicatimonas pelagia TaxID=931531 RepID=UPI0026651007|nr:hypothetical protein [Tunicatimonas pelagia]WKN45623.1 hypothetical protein P0M28_11710 [Tunicatimonas pelagia]